MKIGIANDHSAVDMKNEIVEYLESLGHEIMEEMADPKERTESAESSAGCEGTGNGQ